MKLKILTLNLVIAVMLAALFYGFFYYVSREKTNSLIALTMQNARLSARALVPSVEYALANPQDETTMRATLNSILRIDSVSESFILDSAGLVVAHSDYNQVGDHMGGSIFQAALSPQNPILEQSYGATHILYSKQITSRFTLFMLISTQRDISRAKVWHMKYAGVLGVSWFVVMLVTFILSRKLFDEDEEEGYKNPDEASQEEDLQPTDDTATSDFV
ncbi:MAG: hypothetical protein FWC85_03250 [Elusimicrobia bacterium]|nr:hypothetical protein [Elusimicrobiota bacterium]